MGKAHISETCQLQMKQLDFLLFSFFVSFRDGSGKSDVTSSPSFLPSLSVGSRSLLLLHSNTSETAVDGTVVVRNDGSAIGGVAVVGVADLAVNDNARACCRLLSNERSPNVFVFLVSASTAPAA